MTIVLVLIIIVIIIMIIFILILLFERPPRVYATGTPRDMVAPEKKNRGALQCTRPNQPRELRGASFSASGKVEPR